MESITIYTYSRCTVNFCDSAPCSSVHTSALLSPRSDDALEIKFMLYKETKHVFTLDGDAQEIWKIPSTTEVITVRPSELHNHDSTSIMQSVSSRRIVDLIINTHFPQKHKMDFPEIVAAIIDGVQNFNPLVPNGFIQVKRIEGIEILHHLDDEVYKAYVHGHFEATNLGTCAICMDDFEVGCNKSSNTRRLPCFHVFDGVCISKWLEIDLHCPLCRYFLSPTIAPWFNT